MSQAAPETGEAPFLTADELADRWRMNPGTLGNWRSAGKGPAFFRRGGAVLYRLSDVHAYEQSNTIQGDK